MYLTINYILLLLSPSRLASRSSQKLAELLHVPLAAAAVAAAVMHLTFAVDTRHSIFFFFSFFFQIFFPPSLFSSFDMCLARGLTGDWKALSPWSRRAKEREQTCRQTDIFTAALLRWAWSDGSSYIFSGILLAWLACLLAKAPGRARAA